MTIFGDAWDWTKGAAGDVWDAVTDPVTGETVSPYDPDYNNFLLSQQARQNIEIAQKHNFDDRHYLANFYNSATQAGQAGQAAAAAQQSALDRGMTDRVRMSSEQAAALRDQAAFAGRNQQIARSLTEAAGAYGDAGVTSQQGAMDRLQALSAGQTAGGQAVFDAAQGLQQQYGRAGVSGQESAINRLQTLAQATPAGSGAANQALTDIARGQTANAVRARAAAQNLQGYRGTPAQQDVLASAQQARAAQTADTSGIQRSAEMAESAASLPGVQRTAQASEAAATGANQQGLQQAAQGSAALATGAAQQGVQRAAQASEAAATGAAQQGLMTTAQRAQGGPQNYGQQQRGIDRLEAFADRGPGQSAAEIQLRQGQDAAIAGQMALARSGRGGSSSAALRQAQATAAGIQQQTNAQAAQLRAQEQQAFRAQELAALGQAAQARGQMQSTMGGQELQGLQQAAQAYQGAGQQQLAALGQAQQGYQQAGAQQLAALGQAAQAYQGAGQQQLAALGQAQQGYQQTGAQQLAAAQAVGDLETRALAARDAAQSRGLQALGIEAQQAQAIGGQQLAAQQAALGGFQAADAQQAQAAQALAATGQADYRARMQAAQAAQQAAATYSGQQLQAQQAALGAYQAQQGQMAQAAQAQGQLGATYGGQRLSAIDQATAASLQGQQIDDARRLGLLGLAQSQDQMVANLYGDRVQSALGFGGLGKGYFDSTLQAQQGALSGMRQAGIGYGGLLSDYDQMDLQGRMGYENLKSGNIMSAQLGNQQSDAQRDAAILGLFGAAGGAAIAASDVRAKENIERRPNAASEALAKAPGYSYSYRPEVVDATTAPPGRQFGPMAQDLERDPVTRSAVREGPGGMKTIDTGRLALIDAAATGEQERRIKELEARLARLGAG